MKKKYVTPKCKVIDIDTTEIIAGSGGYTDKQQEWLDKHTGKDLPPGLRNSEDPIYKNTLWE